MSETSHLVKIEQGRDALYSDDVQSLKASFLNHLKYSLVKDGYSATKRDLYKCVALTVMDRLVERWLKTQQTYYNVDAKRVYYLSMEFLIGKSLGNALENLGLFDHMKTAIDELGFDLDELRELEWDAGLGNGGLGRLAACFMDSLATLGIPAYGYGIRYEYGIFFQRMRNGYQVETPDNWLRYGNAWEIERHEIIFLVKFYGRLNEYYDKRGRLCHEWVDTQDVVAVAYDTPIPGYQNDRVNDLRLWSAKSTREFDLGYFQHGDYEKAVSDKVFTETISKVLYPDDNANQGKELRLKQEYFFVSATLMDIVRRYKKHRKHDFSEFPSKVAIQLNDTHPAIAIAELMRILMDEEELEWEIAWKIVEKTFAYTNHTILPEALEKWTVNLLGQVLPRHIQIIYEINKRFMDMVSSLYPGDVDRLRRMSLIEEGHEKKVRMAYLAIVGSHSVNGVSALHSEILKDDLFKDFYDIWPQKFNNKTNGITQRRFLKLANPNLSNLISGHIGDRWVTDLSEIRKLDSLAGNEMFLKHWHDIKLENKRFLSKCIKEHVGVEINPHSLFDCQLKRIHEYKRQLLNALHVIYLYNRIKENPNGDFVPRTVIFAGKAAPGYYMAKLIIKLISSIAARVNGDMLVGDRLKVVFMGNYSVTIAEKLIPASDLSEQISTAGTEASGTGNMKFALNGAVTIGTLDGANIEIRQEVGPENFFDFGLTKEEVIDLKNRGYHPRAYYESDPYLKEALEQISRGDFSPDDQTLFHPLVESLLDKGDTYMLLADFKSYVTTQKHVSETYRDWKKWAKMSISNTSGMGYFSSDRTIREYAEDIWNTAPLED